MEAPGGPLFSARRHEELKSAQEAEMQNEELPEGLGFRGLGFRAFRGFLGVLRVFGF